MNEKQIDCLCTYCGTRWVRTIGYGWSSEPLPCKKCGDTKIIMTERSPASGDAFGYRYSPAFPPKPIRFNDY